MAPSVRTTISEAPITEQRPVPTDLDERGLSKPAVPRANCAVSVDKPDGPEKYPDPAMKKQTVLQQHCNFFDRDGDGVLWPWDTYLGFRRIGFGYVISVLAMFVVHSGFSYATNPSWIPDPAFRVWVTRIHKAKHGSDSDVYDHEGRYRPQHFEELYTKFDSENRGGFYFEDVQKITTANMNVMDFFGWFASRLEWYAFYYIAHDEKGFVSKERVRSMYDGTLWYTLEEENNTRRKRTGIFKNVKDDKGVKQK